MRKLGKVVVSIKLVTAKLILGFARITGDKEL